MSRKLRHFTPFPPTEGGLKIPIRLSKEELQGAEVIGQVDGKYIAIVAQRRLILVDQHAADERIKFERLLAELNAMETLQLDPVLRLDLTPADSAVIARYGPHLENWGIRVEVLSLAPEPPTRNQSSRHFATQTESHYFGGQSHVCVTHLPRIIADRCMLYPDQIQVMIFEYIESLASSHRPDDCPNVMMAILKSKACRGAVMFNDPLSLPQCHDIIQRLSNCQYPFQCAHGRPSMVPLIHLDQLNSQ